VAEIGTGSDVVVVGLKRTVRRCVGAEGVVLREMRRVTREDGTSCAGDVETAAVTFRVDGCDGGTNLVVREAADGDDDMGSLRDDIPSVGRVAGAIDDCPPVVK
jgi:hypothetical protein